MAAKLTVATLSLQVLRTLVRMGAVTHIYGFVFSLGVPLRIFYANALNAAASLSAMAIFTKAKLRGEPLRWLKTEHSYPSRAALMMHKRKLGEILVGSGYVDEKTLEQALLLMPEGRRLGEQLMAMGALTEDGLYEALSLQQSLPLTRIVSEEVERAVARSLPKQVALEWKVLPFRIYEGRLHVASPDVPDEDVNTVLRGFTSLEIQFHLVTPAVYKELSGALL